MSWLEGASGPDSEAQLRGAQKGPVVHGHEMEQLARLKGFKNANEMMLWAKQRNTPTGGTIPGDRMSQTEGAMMLHPKNLLNYILQKYSTATQPSGD